MIRKWTTTAAARRLCIWRGKVKKTAPAFAEASDFAKALSELTKKGSGYFYMPLS